MSSKIITQDDVNYICMALKQGGEEITITKVKNLLNRGTHSQLSHAVDLFKKSPNKAKELSHIKISTNKNDFNNENFNIYHRELCSLIMQKTTLTKEQINIKVRELTHKFLNEEITNKTQIAIDQKKKIECKLRDITTDYVALKKRYDNLKNMYDALDTNLRMTKNISPLEIKKIKQEAQGQNISVKTKVTSTHHEQLKELSGKIVCSYDIARNLIIFKYNCYPTFIREWKKILDQGKKGILDANTHWNFSKKYYELSNFTKKTIHILANNGAKLSKEVEAQFYNFNN